MEYMLVATAISGVFVAITIGITVAENIKIVTKDIMAKRNR